MSDDNQVRARRGGGGWIAAFVLLAFAAGLIGSPWFERTARSVLPPALQSSTAPVQDARIAERLNALEARIAAAEQGQATPAQGDAALAARVAALEAVSATAASAGAPAGGAVSVSQALPDAAASRLATIESRVAALDQASTGAAVSIDQIKSDIARLDSQSEQTRQTAQGARAVVLVTRLRALALAGRPLDPALIQAASTLPGVAQADIAALRSARQVASLAALQQSFARLQPALASGVGGNADWVDRAVAEVRNLVDVQAKDGSNADATGLAALAARRVQAGDIGGALQALERMPAGAQAPARTWISTARTRQTVLAALTRIETASLAAMPAGQQ